MFQTPVMCPAGLFRIGPTGHTGTTKTVRHQRISMIDLQRSEEQGQHEKEEAYVEQYFNKQAERRKRYKVNHCEHVWQAQERLAMSFNDYRATVEFVATTKPSNPAATFGVEPITATPSTLELPSTTLEVETKIDKSWMPKSMTLDMEPMFDKSSIDAELTLLGWLDSHHHWLVPVGQWLQTWMHIMDKKGSGRNLDPPASSSTAWPILCC